MLKNVTILAVEPGEASTDGIVPFLQTHTQAHVLHAKNPTEALKHINNHKTIALLITDLFLPHKSGLQLIQNGVCASRAIVPIVIMPPGGRQYIVESFQAGAYFYINTPYHGPEIIEVIKNALEYQKLLRLGLQQTPRLRKSDGFSGIIGESAPMKKLFRTLERVAASNHGNVLLKGESGTGKELAARAIHDLTPGRNQHHFVPVNCAAIPDDLLESELFGFEKGAFTGANRAKRGRLHHADKGTLFLDEIGDMKPNLQAKLLRVLQEQTFEPIGSVHSVKIDVRIIAATNRDLEQAVRDGTFRDDLFYRLSVVPITLPPLRERTEDIPHLVQKFLLMYNRGRQHVPLGFTERAMEALKAYGWPGNVRELQNLVQRMCILHSEDTVDIGDLPKKFRNTASTQIHVEGNPENDFNGTMDFHAMTSEFENRLILKALHITGWNKKEAARILNMKRTTLLEKIKKRNLDRKKVETKGWEPSRAKG